MSWGKTKDAGAWFKALFAKAETDVTAGGSGDNSEVTCAWIDRKGFQSLEALIAYTATLAGDATLSFKANLQHSDEANGSNPEDFGAAYPVTVQATGDSGGSTETGVLQLGFDLTMAKRYVCLQFTPDLSAANTDTAKVTPVYVLGGSVAAPANSSRANLRAV